MTAPGPIRVGIGGWTFEPWRDNFYPAKWPHKRELEYASRQLTAIEINGTFYSTFKPESWANSVPRTSSAPKKNPATVITMMSSGAIENRV